MTLQIILVVILFPSTTLAYLFSYADLYSKINERNKYTREREGITKKGIKMQLFIPYYIDFKRTYNNYKNL